MAMTAGVLSIVWRILCLGLLFVLLIELGKSQKDLKNGEPLRRLRAVLASMLFVILFPTISVIDTYTDISPGFEWRGVLENTVWIAYATLFTSLGRFWYVIHQWVKKRKNNIP
jgi:hypothetical protein